MKFKYTKTPATEYASGFISLPLLPVRLVNHDNAVELKALVDSGADHSLFPSDIASVLGIDLLAGTPRTYYGIGDQLVLGFLHPIELQVKGFNEVIEIEVAFTEDNRIPVIGQIGFFDNYQVIFERYRGRFEIRSRTHLYR